MNQQLFSYNQEIQPMIRELLKKKELLKDFVDSDEDVQRFVDEVKESQEALKSYIAESERGKEILEQIKNLENDIKLATKAAVKGTQYKPAEFKAYSIARAKQGIEKVVQKGELFETLNGELE